jgi:vacuolar protein 8
VQLLEAEDDQLTNNIRSSPILISSIRQLASSPPPSRSAGGRHEGGSDDEYEDEGLDADGEGEIAGLARRILDLTENGQDGPESRFTNRSERDEVAGSQGSGGDTAALRASVHRALSGGN